MIRAIVLMKASFLQLRVYFLILLGYMALSILTDVVLNLALGYGENSHISFGNIFVVILFLVTTVLPTGYFKRVVHLGASRKEYYSGLLMTYTVCTIALALLQIVWVKVEAAFNNIYGNHAIHLINVFGWDRFGLLGMFVYQFGAYMLLISFLNMLVSGLWHKAGRAIWWGMAAMILIGTLLPSFRTLIADIFMELLVNDSLLYGFGLTFFLSCLFLAGGWWFTKRRAL